MTNRRFSETEKLFFFKRLAQLTHSGIPLLDSFSLLEAGAPKHAKEMCTSLASYLERGQTLSQALARFPRYFKPFDMSVVSIGESSGTLPASLGYLAEELGKRRTLRRKVLGSLLYPALITFATFAITAFLTVYLFPRIMPVFLSLHIPLPLTTRVMLATSSFLLSWGWLVLLTFIALIIGCAFWYRFDARTRTVCARLMLRVPVVGPLLRDYHLATTLRTFGLLLTHSVRLTEAVALTVATSTHLEYRAAYEGLSERVARGERISRALSIHPYLFPPLVVQMLEVGERSSSLPETLQYLAALYETDIEETTRTLSTLVEPALMILMGLLVGFIAVSIIAPLYGVTQHLHG